MSVNASVSLKKDTIVINNQNHNIISRDISKDIDENIKVIYPDETSNLTQVESSNNSINETQYYKLLEKLTLNSELKIYSIEELADILKSVLTNVTDVDFTYDLDTECRCLNKVKDIVKISSIIITSETGCRNDLKIKYNDIYRFLLSHGVDLKHVKLC